MKPVSAAKKYPSVWWILIGAVVLAVFFILWQLSIQERVVPTLLLEEQSRQKADRSGIELANPASVFCEQVGGAVKNRETPAGETGYCVLPDGSICQEWRYFYTKGAECLPPPEVEATEYSSETSCQTDCQQKGFDKGLCRLPADQGIAILALGPCVFGGSDACAKTENCQCYCYKTVNSRPINL